MRLTKRGRNVVVAGKATGSVKGSAQSVVGLVILGALLLVGCVGDVVEDPVEEPGVFERVLEVSPEVSYESSGSGGGGAFRDCSWNYFQWGPRYDYHVVAWSPDGSEVFFAHGWDIYGVTANGWRLRLIATGAPPDEIDPPLPVIPPVATFAVAPDGRHIVLASCRYPPAEFTMPDGRVVLDAGGGRFELVRMTVDGGSMVRLTTNWGVNLYPAWSPDGRRIGYVSDAELVDRTTSGARVSLYTMAADGSDVRLVLDDDFPALHYPPAWSPDGENLAVVRYGESKMGFASSITNIGRDLYVVGADGQNPRLVAGNVVSGPSWSPDGQRLAIAQAEEDGVGLYIIGIDGTGSRRVTGIEGWQGPSRTRVAMDSADPAEAWIGTVAWSPDGTRILVRSNQSYPVLVVSVETGKAIDVGSGFQPAGAHIGVRAAAWSPDGSRIAMTGGGKVEQGEAPHIVGTVAADGTDVKVLALVGAGDVLVAERAQEPDVVASQAKCSDGTLVSDPAGNAGLVRDCEVLLGLRDALFGESGKKLNWSPGTPMTEWLGVTIAGTPPRVTALELVGSIVRGRLPSAVGDLSALRVLELIGSFLPGPIPAELGGLAQLRTLRLASAHLRGPIPPAFGQLTNLETLDLGGNFLTGTIPPELGRLASLETLDLSRNALSGAIPVELSHLVNLRTLHLESNELNGRIPPELGRLPNLERVALDGNHRLTGCVPLELPVDDPASLGLSTCEPG